jgi:Thrombospondin type 3 repeat
LVAHRKLGVALHADVGHRRDVSSLPLGVVLILACACGRLGFSPPEDDADADGDGVADFDDNCPALANADQDDEDADLVGDRCDNCPISSNDGDSDGDDVGDACDPFPSTPGDRIEYFAGFERSPSEAMFEFFASNGSWAVSGGKAHVTGGDMSLTAATWPVTGMRETVSTQVVIDRLFGDRVARPVGVVHQFDGAAREGTECVFGINPANEEIYAIANNFSTAALRIAPTNANVGDSSWFASSRDQIDYSCDAERLVTPLTASNNLFSSPNRVGLFARNVSATYDWLLIVTSP